MLYCLMLYCGYHIAKFRKHICYQNGSDAHEWVALNLAIQMSGERRKFIGELLFFLNKTNEVDQFAKKQQFR